MSGLESLIFGAIKFAFAKGAVAAVAHASPNVLTATAMHGAINVTNAAIATRNVVGRAVGLVVR